MPDAIVTNGESIYRLYKTNKAPFRPEYWRFWLNPAMTSAVVPDSASSENCEQHKNDLGYDEKAITEYTKEQSMKKIVAARSLLTMAASITFLLSGCSGSDSDIAQINGPQNNGPSTSN